MSLYVPEFPTSEQNAYIRDMPPLKELAEHYDSEEDTTLDQFAELNRQYENYQIDYYLREKARKKAHELIQVEENRASLEEKPLRVLTLEEALKEPEEPQRVKGLTLANGSTLIAASAKTGKTTLTLNLAYSLLTGYDFLDHFQIVEKVAGNIAFLNFELPPRLFATWSNQRGLDPKRIRITNLRGEPNPFADPYRLEELGRILKQTDTETIIVDPFTVAYTGENENDIVQVRGWLEDLNAWARTTVQARDLILVDHMGKMSESARGASAKEDWPDTIIRLTRGQRNTPSENMRYFSATGRVGEVPEDELFFNPFTLALSLTGHGNRARANERNQTAANKSAILDYLTGTHEPVSGREIEQATGIKKGMKEALDELISENQVSKTHRRKQGGGYNYELIREDDEEDISIDELLA